jgi:membrane protease YdiL (CAAX protease family)
MAANIAAHILPSTAGHHPALGHSKGAGMNPILAIARRRPLASFFVLTFALCWGLGAVLDGTMLAPDGIFLSGVLIAALIVVAVADGRSGLKDLGRRLLRWRVAPRWYAVVFLLPVAIIGTVAALTPLLGGAPLDWSKQLPLTTTALLFAIFLFVPLAAPLSEEIGWRGVALPRMLARRSALTASVILGVVWSIWHVPVVMSDPALRVPVPFLLQVIPLSVLMTWIFLHTRGSIFIAVLFHAWVDVVLGYVGAMVAPGDYALLWWLILATQTVAALVVVAIWGPKLIRGPSGEAAVSSSAAAPA